MPLGPLSVIIAAASLMTWLPAQQAARIAPAEALRHEKAHAAHHPFTGKEHCVVQEQGRITRHLTLTRAVVSVIFAIVLLLGVGVVVDVLAFDRTTGGTPPDYQDFSGTPIDWDSYERTDNGFVGHGYVLNAHLDCTTGMLSYEVLGIKRDFRELSDRALHVHQPREACVRHGFEPEF